MHAAALEQHSDYGSDSGVDFAVVVAVVDAADVGPELVLVLEPVHGLVGEIADPGILEPLDGT